MFLNCCTVYLLPNVIRLDSISVLLSLTIAEERKEKLSRSQSEDNTDVNIHTNMINMIKYTEFPHILAVTYR